MRLTDEGNAAAVEQLLRMKKMIDIRHRHYSVESIEKRDGAT